MTNAVQQMLTTSRDPLAEEYAIHDYEGWGPLRLSEYESLGTIALLAAGIDAHGAAFLHLAAGLDRSDWDQLDRFDELYRGHWNSTAQYAETTLEECGIESGDLGPAWLLPYIEIDTESMGHNMAADLIVSEAREGGVHLFEQP